ncbi:MAG: hypothetical protein WCB09_11960, partial [Methylocella sp.]
QTSEGVRQSLFPDGVAHLLTIQYFALTAYRTKLYSGRAKVYPVSAMDPVQPACAGLIFGGS